MPGGLAPVLAPIALLQQLVHLLKAAMPSQGASRIVPGMVTKQRGIPRTGAVRIQLDAILDPLSKASKVAQRPNDQPAGCQPLCPIEQLPPILSQHCRRPTR